MYLIAVDDDSIILIVSNINQFTKRQTVVAFKVMFFFSLYKKRLLDFEL